MAVGTIETEAQLEAFVRQRLDGWVGSLVQRVAGSGLLLRIARAAAQAIGVDFGTANLSWSGSSATAGGAFPHGLGVVPKAVIACSQYKSGVMDAYVAVDPALSTATQFSVFARSTTSPAVGSYPFYWVAIG